jgi:hypothetical protein
VGVACLFGIAALIGCGGAPTETVGIRPSGSVDAGVASDGSGPDAGTAVDSGGAGPDPFAAAPTCSSAMTWTRGDHGSAVMNPGRACLACHAANHGPAFTIAGTVYPTGHEPDLCDGAGDASSASITVTGADGLAVTLTPNAAGNFYSATPLKLPLQARISYQGRERAMSVGQASGDCNGCHTQAGDSGAPGRIVLP